MSLRPPHGASNHEGDTTVHRHARRSLVVRTVIAMLAFAGFGLLAMACTSSGSGEGAVVPDTAGADSTVPATATTLPPDTTNPSGSTLVPDTGSSVVTGADIPVTTARTGGECAGVELVPSAVAEAIFQIDGDWNGDAVADVALSWREPNGAGWTWFVRTEITGGAGAAYALGDLGVGFAQLLGKVEVDGTGASATPPREEILAVAGASAAGYQLGVFGVGDDGCVFRFDDGFGGPFVVPVTGGGTRLAGLRCDSTTSAPPLVELEATSFDGVTWGTYERRISRSGPTTLVLGEPAVSILAGTDPLLAAYGQAGCNGQIYLDESRPVG